MNIHKGVWNWIEKQSKGLNIVVPIIIGLLGFMGGYFFRDRVIINFDEANYNNVNVKQLSGENALLGYAIVGNPKSDRGARMFLGGMRENGCIQVRDIDNGGWTKIYTLNGQIISKEGACDIGKYEIITDPSVPQERLLQKSISR